METAKDFQSEGPGLNYYHLEQDLRTTSGLQFPHLKNSEVARLC